MEIGMNSITNYCRFIGTLVEDPELETLETTSVVTFTLAIHEYIKEKSSGGRKKKIVNYFDFEAWDTGATAIAKLCKKGDMVDIVSSARNNRWKNTESDEDFETRFRVKEFQLFNKRARQEVYNGS